MISTYYVYGQQSASEAWIDKGYEAYENSKFDEAIVMFQNAIDLDSSKVEAFYLKGVCQAQVGINIAAIKSFDKALILDPTYAEVHFEKGYAYFVLNKYKEAIESFDKAIKYRPDYAEAWFNRGSVKCIQGEKKAALGDWEKAKALGASIPDLTCD